MVGRLDSFPQQTAELPSLESKNSSVGWSVFLSVGLFVDLSVGQGARSLFLLFLYHTNPPPS